jgi:inosose dehydratase
MTTPNHSPSSPDLARLTLGTAPDSWGVWFPLDDHQVGWQQYLDEVALAGYLHTELGPQGFLPQDPAQLRDELAKRNLTVTGGTVFAGLHKGSDALDKAKDDFGREARLLREVGAEYLVHLPEQYTDMHGGALTESAEIDPEQWQNLVGGTNELARYLLEEFGIKLVFHPHADTHVDTQERVERFLADTDSEPVNLCLDTGHISYCDGDNVEIIERFPERITYVHLKQVDPEVRERVRQEKLSLAEAVPLGVDVRAAVRRAGLPAAARRARGAGP